MNEMLAFLQQPQIAIPIVVVTVVAIFLTGRRWTAMYVGLMPVINWAFAGISTIPIPEDFGGGSWHPFTVITGLVLVVRDFAQREIKHWIFAAMIAGLALSTLTAWPVIVVASGVAFLISETADWAVYTFSNRPLSQRILISSCISAPIDQVLFIYLASLVVPGIFAWGTIVTGVVSKLIGAYFVSRVVAAQERRNTPQNDMNPA